MRAFSILDIPEYKVKELKKSIFGCSIDYRRFNFSDRKAMNSIFITDYIANDTDNSNVKYDRDTSGMTFDGHIAYLRINSPRGKAFQVIISFEGIGPVPILMWEGYNVGQGLRGSVGRIDFYGAFFHFWEYIPRRYQELYDQLNDEERCTRADVALDFDFVFPQNGLKWITPSKNSEREVQCYRHQGKFNSYGYLSEKNTGYGVRIYNKSIEIVKSGKDHWYQELPENWTRIEFEFYPPYSTKKPEELKKYVLENILGLSQVNLGLKYRAGKGYKVENAYDYFSRYAKRHGIEMSRLIDDIVAHHIKVKDLQVLT